MEIKETTQGLLIYITIAAYLLALIFTLFRKPKIGHKIYFLGFLAAIVSFVYRWLDTGHVPMQNLFEVFLCLGMIYPITIFSKKVLHVGGQAADMFLGVIVLFPAGFVFNAEPQRLPPTLQSWLFAPHVAVYMLSYIFLAKASFHAYSQYIHLSLFIWRLLLYLCSFLPIRILKKIITLFLQFVLSFFQFLLYLLTDEFNEPINNLLRSEEVSSSAKINLILQAFTNNLHHPEEASYKLVCIGFPLLTLGLVLGSVWGKQAWGDYWGWDPKELWSLASWLVYVGYLHFRYMFGKKYPLITLINSLWVILGFTVIIITLLWVNLSRLFPGLHNYGTG